MSTSVRTWTVPLVLLACAPAFLRCARSTSANATAAPSVTSVAPIQGPLAGGTLITITGTGFTLTATVAIGGKACTEVVPLSATTITCSTPAVVAAIAADIVVTNRNFTTGELAAGTLTGGFNYQAAPTVVSATSGFFMGGTTITVTGTAFRAGATVTIGGSDCTSVSVTSLTTLTCVNPAGVAGATGAVIVTNTDAQSGSLAGGFTWRQVQYTTFLDGNGTQGLAKNQTENASRPILIGLTSKIGAVWQESKPVGGPTQIRGAAFDGNTTTPTLGSWSFFDNGDATKGLNFDDTKSATNPFPVVLSSKLYLTWTEMGAANKQIRVRVNTGSLSVPSWSFVEKAVPDNKGLNFNSTRDADEASAAVNTNLFVAWREFDGSFDQVRVSSYNGNDGTPVWTSVVPAGGNNFNSSFSSTHPSLGVVSNKLFGIWSESDGTNLIIRMKEYSGAGTAWTNRNVSAGAGNNCSQAPTRDAVTPTLYTFNAKLYATWIEANAGAVNQVRVAVYDDTSKLFTCVDGASLNKSTAANASRPRLATLGTTLYATWSEGATGQIRVATYNGNDGGPAWTFVDGNLTAGLNKDTLKTATFPSLLTFGSQFYGAWTETDGSTTSIRVKLGN